jgi:hypothetical protein
VGLYNSFPCLLDESLHEWKEGRFRTGHRITDITDGECYHKSQIRFRKKLNVPKNDLLLTLVWNTDGLLYHTSSESSVWPVFATLSELPRSIRFNSDKILNLALWHGEGKPPIMAILRSIRSELDAINSIGLPVQTKIGPKNVFVCAPAVTADIPAKSFLMNMVGHNGLHPCSLCTIEGQNTTSGRGNCRTFIQGELGDISPRTDASIRLDAENATIAGFPVSHLEYLNFI